MTNLDSILKSKDITLLTKVHRVKSMVFPVVMYGWESWTIKKAERQRIDASELWCWRRVLRIPWTARRSNQSILKEIGREYSMEGLMLKLKLQNFVYCYEKSLMLGKTECRRRRGWRRMRWLDSTTDSMDVSLSELCTAVHRVTKIRSWLHDWTSTKTILKKDSQGELTFVFRSRRYEPGIFK